MRGVGKNFGLFVGRRIKPKNRSIVSLKGVEEVSVSSTKSKLELFTDV